MRFSFSLVLFLAFCAFAWPQGTVPEPEFNGVFWRVAAGKLLPLEREDSVSIGASMNRASVEQIRQLLHANTLLATCWTETHCFVSAWTSSSVPEFVPTPCIKGLLMEAELGGSRCEQALDITVV